MLGTLDDPLTVLLMLDNSNDTDQTNLRTSSYFVVVRFDFPLFIRFECTVLIKQLINQSVDVVSGRIYLRGQISSG